MKGIVKKFSRDHMVHYYHRDQLVHMNHSGADGSNIRTSEQLLRVLHEGD
jgi:hypothetical protein